MKKILFIIIAVFSINITVSAINQELEENISKAEKRCALAYSELYKLAGDDFLIYVNDKWTDRCYEIEKELRNKYPQEYEEYINAVGEYDDLLYAKYIGEIVNAPKHRKSMNYTK